MAKVRINERRFLLVRVVLTLVLVGLWLVLERGAYLILGTALIVGFFIFGPYIFEWRDDGDAQPDIANPS